MQRAVSSDTLSTKAFEEQPHNFAGVYDAKQQLCHSQSMILPENGKVFASKEHTQPQTCTVCREGKKENQLLAEKIEQTCKYSLTSECNKCFFFLLFCSWSTKIIPAMWPTSLWSPHLLRAPLTVMAALL